MKQRAIEDSVRSIALCLALALTVACGGEPEGGGQYDPQYVLASDGEALSQVLAADRAFARDVAARGLEAWMEAFSEDGSLIPASGPVIVGFEAVRFTMATAFATPGFEIVWEPLGGMASSCGDLAYTYGDYEHRVAGDVVRSGRYLTVWQRQSDGSWRVAADIGNEERDSQNIWEDRER